MALWFRMYEALLDDPKVQKLKPELFKAWVNLLAIASRYEGVLPSVADCAFALRVSEDKAGSWLWDLNAAGLIDKSETGYAPHNWASRQFKSDVSNERVKRHRERQRNAECNVTETPSESEAEERQSRAEQKDHSAAAKPGADAKRGTRLTDDWQLTPELRGFASDLGLDPDGLRDEFVDYWTSVPGSKGLKLDWSKTFKNRCRELGKRPGPKGAETFEQRRVREAREAIRQ